jgi:hypothetical protein
MAKTVCDEKPAAVFQVLLHRPVGGGAVCVVAPEFVNAGQPCTVSRARCVCVCVCVCVWTMAPGLWLHIWICSFVCALPGGLCKKKLPPLSLEIFADVCDSSHHVTVSCGTCFVPLHVLRAGQVSPKRNDIVGWSENMWRHTYFF